MAWVMNELHNLGVKPTGFVIDSMSDKGVEYSLVTSIVTRAREVMRKQGWILPIGDTNVTVGLNSDAEIS